MKTYTLLAISRVDVTLGDLRIDVTAGDRVVLSKMYKDILDGSSRASNFLVIAESEEMEVQPEAPEAPEAKDNLMPMVDPIVTQLISESIPAPDDTAEVYVPLEPDAPWQTVKAYLNQLEEVFPIDKAKVLKVKEMFPSYATIQTLCDRLLQL